MKLYQLKKQALEIGIKDFYAYVRNFYLEKNGFDTIEVDEDKKETLDKIVSDAAELLKVDKENLWDDKRFHLNFRITEEEIDALEDLEIDEKTIANANESVKEGRDMSILPLNALIGGDTIKKYIPFLIKRYSKDKKHTLDGYGIFTKRAKIEAIIEDKAGKQTIKLLASRKFDYAALANITDYCPNGCAGCYKGSITRLKGLTLAEIDPNYREVKEKLEHDEKRAVEQIRLLTQWLNKHDEVDTIVISGGEPLFYKEETVGKILEEIAKAKYVDKVRICTGTVYNGSFFNITDKMIEKFKEFKKNNPNKEFYINANVTDENQLITPEAKIVTKRLKDAGITIHLQMPIQEGINFYRDDLKKTAGKMIEVCRAAHKLGVDPYKAIVDIHSPDHPEITVPIEYVSKVLGALYGHKRKGDMAVWRVVNILDEQGNEYVERNLNAEKEVDIKNGKVTYFLAAENILDNKITIHIYVEPLLPGINDRGTLAKPIPKIREKINEVKKAYQLLREEKIDAEDFYRISGIELSVNEPLIIKK